MVSKARNTILLKIVFDSADISTLKHFRAYSASDELGSAYAQTAVEKNLLSHAFVPLIGVLQCHNLLQFHNLFICCNLQYHIITYILRLYCSE
jgi:hypothetical protein